MLCIALWDGTALFFKLNTNVDPCLMWDKMQNKSDYSSFWGEHNCVNHISGKFIQLLSSGVTKSPKCQSHSGLIKKKSGGRQEVDWVQWLCKNMSRFIQHSFFFFPTSKTTSGPGIICSHLSNVVATMIGHISTIEPGVKSNNFLRVWERKSSKAKRSLIWNYSTASCFMLFHGLPIQRQHTVQGTTLRKLWASLERLIQVFYWTVTIQGAFCWNEKLSFSDLHYIILEHWSLEGMLIQHCKRVKHHEVQLEWLIIIASVSEATERITSDQEHKAR